ncbi:DUF4395 domain-containing protein [Kitasatospora sp. NPDC006697]|uniref:DUF4395 domain-containing protein n=1 Tax=Kitasatospora sp. NPDC006697 TaxID=3364020 RepID=UPI0036BE1C5B
MQIDPRGPRFAASLTTLVLAVVLVTGSGWLLAAQTLVFALGASDLGRSPYGWLYRRLVRPRLGPPQELEDARAPQFAQAVGLVFGLLGTVGYLAGLTWLGLAATGCALAAAFLNSAFGYCLGCELYLLLRRGQARVSGHQD